MPDSNQTLEDIDLSALIDEEDSSSASDDDTKIEVIVNENCFYSKRDMRCLRKKLFQDMISLDNVEKTINKQLDELRGSLDKASDEEFMQKHIKIKELEDMIVDIPKNIMLLKVQLANHDLRGAGSLDEYFKRSE